jgi:predicted nucleic acid-binding protein
MALGLSPVGAFYLDASALVKLVANDLCEEKGRTAIREFFWGHANMYATSYCVAETFGALKRKFVRKEISKDEYIKCVRDFIQTVLGAHLQEDEMPILSPSVLRLAERLIDKHEIDFIDCFQIATMLSGRFSMFDRESKSVLITADDELAKVARAEGAIVWICTTELPPYG